jgi:hypothetical protein
MVTANQFKEWVRRSRQGGMCIYYKGYLAIDRFEKIYDPTKIDAEPTLIGNAIDGTGRAALEAFDAGKVHLFQRKLHDCEYEYIAMKASRRNW